MKDPHLIDRGTSHKPGLRVWQGYTGEWFWQLTDGRGMILTHHVGGEASTREEATAKGREAQEEAQVAEHHLEPFRGAQDQHEEVDYGRVED